MEERDLTTPIIDGIIRELELRNRIIAQLMARNTRLTVQKSLQDMFTQTDLTGFEVAEPKKEHKKTRIQQRLGKKRARLEPRKKRKPAKRRSEPRSDVSVPSPIQSTSRTGPCFSCGGTTSPMFRQGWATSKCPEGVDLCNRCGLRYSASLFCPVCKELYKWSDDSHDAGERWIGCSCGLDLGRISGCKCKCGPPGIKMSVGRGCRRGGPCVVFVHRKCDPDAAAKMDAGHAWYCPTCSGHSY